MATERVVAAAVRNTRTGELRTGLTHYLALGEHDAEMLDDTALAEWDEGFLTDTGRFIDRREASALVYGISYGSLHTGDLPVGWGQEA